MAMQPYPGHMPEQPMQAAGVNQRNSADGTRM